MFKESSNTQPLINQINFRAVIMQIRKSDIDKAQHKIYNPPSIKKKKIWSVLCVAQEQHALCTIRRRPNSGFSDLLGRIRYPHF